MTTQAITLENCHEYLEFRAIENDEDLNQFKVHWDCENDPLNELLRLEFSYKLEEGIKRKSLKWVNELKRLVRWQKGGELLIGFDYFNDGDVFVAVLIEGDKDVPMMKIDSNGYVSMRTYDNYSTDQTDKSSFFVRILSLHNDQVYAELEPTGSVAL